MFEIKDAGKYLLKNNPLAEKTDEMITGLLRKQNEILKEILNAHAIELKDFFLHGSRQIQGNETVIFYKDRPIAIFTKEEMKTDGNTTTLSQKYKILK